MKKLTIKVHIILSLLYHSIKVSTLSLPSITMKFLTVAAALASLAAAAPSGAPTPLDVKLETVGNAGEVKATITNNGKNNLKVFKHGTIFDKAHTEKAVVTVDGK